MSVQGTDGGIDVILEGRAYRAYDDEGRRRFRENGTLAYLRRIHREGTGKQGLDLDRALAVAVEGDLPAHDLAGLLMGLGYTLDGLLELQPFSGWTVAEDPDHAETGTDEPGTFRAIIDGVAYELDEEEDDRLHFRGNAVLMALAGTEGTPGFDLDDLDAACVRGEFGRADYVAFLAMLGVTFVDFSERGPLRECVVKDDEGKGFFMPDRSFTAVAAAPKGSLMPARGPIGLTGLGDEVLYATPLGDAEFGTLHAYMHRRFGYPSMDGDHHKDLSGTWCLSTPDPDLFLLVSPGLGPAFSAFSPYLTPPEGAEIAGDRVRLSPERAAAMRAAYRSVLLDLLRPVSVDGERFNAVGYVDHGTPLMDFPPGGKEYTFAAPYDRGATKGIPIGMAGSREWDELMCMLDPLGGGDEQAGLTRIVALGREIILSDIRKLSENVRILVAAGAVGPWHATVMDGLRLDPRETAIASDVASAFLWAGRSGAPDVTIPEFTEEETREATRLLGSLAINAPMTKAWRGYLHSRQLHRDFETFCELAEAGLPDELLATRARAVESLGGKIRAAGNAALADHVERILSEEGGRHTIGALVSAYSSKLRAERAEAGHGSGSPPAR